MLHTHPDHWDDCRNQLKRAEGSLQYLNNVLAQGDKLQAWELREYNLLKIECLREINRIESHIAKHPNIFKTLK